MSSNSSAVSQQLNTDSSTATFVSALVFNSILGVVFFTVFSVIRTWNKKVYEGRTYLVDESKRSPVLSRGFWGWQRELLSTPDSDIIKRVGLDAYMFLRFMRFSALVFTIFTVIGLPILIPINSVGQQGLGGINSYTMGNVSDDRMFWAHLLISALFASVIVYYTWKEMKIFIDLRQKYLISEGHYASVIARTLLVIAIPPEYNSVEKLTEVFNKFPGGVKSIFINRDVKKLPDDVKERQSLVEKLEGAETNYIKAGIKHLHASKAPDVEKTDISSGRDIEKTSNLPEKLRPRHRTGYFGLYGKKVDSISTYREDIVKLNEKIDIAHANQGEFPDLPSAFICFNTQLAAHMAAQSIIHSVPFDMTPRFTEVNPNDIVWDNLNIGTVQRIIRTGISTTITAAIVLLWTIPTAFVASIASIDALSKVVPFLSVLDKLPPFIFGIIQGILPPVFLAILMALVPIVFKYLTKLEGVPTGTKISAGLLDKYYFFLMVNVLFVTTLSKGAIETLPALGKDPTSAISLLASNVPKASTFFITYILLNGVNSSGMTMLQIAPLAVTYIFDKFLAKTPRGQYNLWSSLGGVEFGQLVPQQTLVFAIGLVYSVIAPLILPFVMIYFYLYYFVYMYQFLYSFNTQIETGGMAFPKAIRHVYISLFIFELLMVGILLGKSAVAQAIIMIIMIFVTAFVLYIMDYSFTPLLNYVPVTLADSKPTDDAAFGELGKSGFGVIGTGAQLISGFVSKTTETVGAGVKKITAPVENTFDKLARGLTLGGHIVHAKEDEVRHLEPVKQESENAYLHPALRNEQPTVWIPRDDYGISTGLVQDLNNDKIKNSTIGATVLEKNRKVVVAQEVFEAAVGVPNGMGAPVDGGANSAQAGISAGVYADNAIGSAVGDIGMMH